VLRDAWLIALKDIRIEIRSRIVTNQIVPYALLILVLFGFALDADTETLRDTGPGLFWVAILLVAILAIQRAVDIENSEAAQERLLLSPLSPISIFLGKALGLFLQLLLLELLLTLAMVALFDVSINDYLLMVASGVIATVGIASVGTLYGVIATGLGVRETLLPVLLLPVLAPVVIGATRTFGDAFGRVNADGWAWVGLLSVFAVMYTLIGMLAYGQLLEEA
tara:strand:- start:823 stop:1491 length:669 start_codon:yes stop_codon:yes gene_type:complete